MDDPSQALLSPSLVIAFMVLVVASVVVVSNVVGRWGRGEPVLPYEKRRQAPWRGMDVLIVFILFEFGGPFFFLAAQSLLPKANEAAVAVDETQVAAAAGNDSAETVDVQHPLVDLLKSDEGAVTWLLCILVAVVVAPLVEEFMYRVVLQGWMEAEVRRARRRVPKLRRFAPGLIPVVLVSLLFAMRHFRMASEPLEPEVLAKGWFYDQTVTKFMGGPGRKSFEAVAWFDRTIIDGVVVGTGRVVQIASGWLRRVENGFVRSYAALLAGGSMLLIAYFLLRTTL
jgi:NADH:ubiquinone oxidoreductase subunit 5 (subunit L)/multisubunit Na+/H+ antiporter MnhA subunit